MSSARHWKTTPRTVPVSEFTDADKVALLTIEVGLTLEPWQFDYLAAVLSKTE